MTKHPNYEFIVAFAEGKEVEYKSKAQRRLRPL